MSGFWGGLLVSLALIAWVSESLDKIAKELKRFNDREEGVEKDGE